jgi:hypothetical protein
MFKVVEHFQAARGVTRRNHRDRTTIGGFTGGESGKAFK